MAENILLYKSLIQIGLKEYLKERGGESIQYEKHMVKIDNFVQKLSDGQRNILKQKINRKRG